MVNAKPVPQWLKDAEDPEVLNRTLQMIRENEEAEAKANARLPEGYTHRAITHPSTGHGRGRGGSGAKTRGTHTTEANQNAEEE